MKKIIVITGPTASGKTSLSIEMALKLDGEIISADSRQVYKGLDIGSGKVTKKETKGIFHHLIDTRKPEEPFSVMDFKKEAMTAIEDISKRGKLPIITGGTYFYIKALLENYQMPEIKIDSKLREKLNSWSKERLIEFLKKESPKDLAKIDKQNPRRLQRAVEIIKLTGKPFYKQKKKGPKIYDAFKFVIDFPREELYERIDKRVDKRWYGMKAETKKLLQEGVSKDWLMGLGLEYNFMTKLELEELIEDEARQQLKFAIHNFARKQLVWMRKDKALIWVKPRLEEANKYIKSFLK